MKPGDKVFHVDPRTAEDFVYSKPIKVGVYIGLVDHPHIVALVHFGWIMPEKVDVLNVFATEEEAKARVAALAKKRIAAIRRELKKLMEIDMDRVKSQDRTGQIGQRRLASLLRGAS